MTEKQKNTVWNDAIRHRNLLLVSLYSANVLMLYTIHDILVNCTLLTWFFKLKCTGMAQKSKPLPSDPKNHIKSYESRSMKLNLFVKLKYQSSTIILLFGIRYSMRDLLSDLNNCLICKLVICVRYGKWYQHFLWHQLALASREFWWRLM